LSDTPEGRPIVPALCTVTLVVPLEILGEPALAVIVVVPRLTGVAVTVALVCPAAIVTVEGMVTTPEGLALKFTVRAEGAGADKVTVRVPLPGPVSV
jgi:hypothetical protein